MPREQTIESKTNFPYGPEVIGREVVVREARSGRLGYKRHHSA
jgi:hypothetical protein